MRRGAALIGAWLLLAAFAQPPANLSYDSDVVDESVIPTSTRPPEPGEQYPASLAEQAASNAPEAARPRRNGPAWRLTVDASTVADSNVTNSTDRESVELNLGGTVLPVPLDPELREHGGIGVGVSVHARGRVPVSPDVSVALDAEGYLLEQEGRLADDASALVAAGIEHSGRDGTTALVQVTGFDRRYAGVSAMRGLGARGRFRVPVGNGQTASLFVDARFFDSDYGEDFGGTEAGAYLSYEAVLRPDLSASAGIYARGSWLGADAYSSREIGTYGGISHYLTSDLTVGVSGGLSRVAFDAPIPILSTDPRRDWRWYGSVFLATREPLLVGLTPSLTYTYNRTGSSIEFYRAERHRLRLGLSRTF
ncbi:MAG TPA: surface lipoprotein assembly modifier [Allosphingosinicella sp.]|jgi:hypothetical protein